MPDKKQGAQLNLCHPLYLDLVVVVDLTQILSETNEIIYIFNAKFGQILLQYLRAS